MHLRRNGWNQNSAIIAEFCVKLLFLLRLDLLLQRHRRHAHGSAHGFVEGHFDLEWIGFFHVGMNLHPHISNKKYFKFRCP